MSAFIVDRAHIDALVALAVKGPRNEREVRPDLAWMRPFHWYHRRDDHGQIVHEPRTADYDTADETGRMLWNENLASVAYRYGDDNEPLPGPIDFAVTDADEYVWPFSAPQLTAVQGLKALACYEYQSCEHPGWHDSAARQFCETLRHRLITALPGYEDAAWEIESASV